MKNAMKNIMLSALVIVTQLSLAQNIHVREQGKVVNLPANAPVMTRQAYAQRASVPARPLNFNAQGSARLTGSIRGLNMAAYRFHGQAGQRVQIVLNGRNYAMEFALFNPRYGMNFGTVHTLPYSGEYEVRIVQTRRNAARNRKHYRYDVTVHLGRASGNPPVVNARRAPVPVPAPAPAPVPVAAARPAPPVVAAAPRPVAGKKRTFRCQSGGSLNMEFFNAQSANPRVVVKTAGGSINLQLDPTQSDNKNAIFTGSNHFLHMIRKGKDVSAAEVLSFDATGGKPLAFGCK